MAGAFAATSLLRLSVSCCHPFQSHPNGAIFGLPAGRKRLEIFTMSKESGDTARHNRRKKQANLKRARNRVLRQEIDARKAAASQTAAAPAA